MKPLLLGGGRAGAVNELVIFSTKKTCACIDPDTDTKDTELNLAFL